MLSVLLSLKNYQFTWSQNQEHFCPHTFVKVNFKILKILNSAWMFSLILSKASQTLTSLFDLMIYYSCRINALGMWKGSISQRHFQNKPLIWQMHLTFFFILKWQSCRNLLSIENCTNMFVHKKYMHFSLVFYSIIVYYTSSEQAFGTYNGLDYVICTYLERR